VAGQAPAHVLRLAGTLCLVDWAIRGGAEPTKIGVDFISAAIRLVRGYFWPHARAALRQVGLTERHINARRVLRWIRAQGKRAVSLKDIRRDALGQRLDAAETIHLLETLTRFGWVREKPSNDAPKAGRPVRRWEINPSLFLNAENAGIAETPLSVTPEGGSAGISAIPAISAPQSLLASERVNGGGIHRRNDMEDCPLAPYNPPDDPDPGPSDCLSRSREVLPHRRTVLDPPDDDIDIPDDLLRCQPSQGPSDGT